MKNYIPTREALLEDGLYAIVKNDDGDEVLFRKFEDSGVWIASTNPLTKEVNGLTLVTLDQLKTIIDAPSIKVGDGTTPQSLGGNNE